MEIILIRHAEPEEKRENVEDLKRHVTEKGKVKFQKQMPEFLEKLEPTTNRQFILWASPATRALETAEIIAQALSIKVDAICDFIYEGNFEKLCAKIQDIAEEATLIIVGHQPALSEWTEAMTQKEVKIAQGEILNFKVSSRSPLKAELQWIVTPESSG